MEYLIILAFQLMGIFFHIVQKVKEIADKIPDEEETFMGVMGLFWKQDYLTVIGSFGVLALHLLVHYVVETQAPQIRDLISYYILWSYALALILGYAGQRLIYGWLGKAEKVLDKKVNDKLN